MNAAEVSENSSVCTAWVQSELHLRHGFSDSWSWLKLLSAAEEGQQHLRVPTIRCPCPSCTCNATDTETLALGF